MIVVLPSLGFRYRFTVSAIHDIAVVRQSSFSNIHHKLPIAKRKLETTVFSMAQVFAAEGVVKALEDAARGPRITSVDFFETFGMHAWLAGKNAQMCSPRLALDACSLSKVYASSFQIDVIVSMLEAMIASASALQHGYQQFLGPITSKLSIGMASLPDDVLSIIFKFAVRGEGLEGAKQAVRLSHVSRRFCNVALGECDLWTVLRAGAEVEELETLLSRSGPNLGFHTFIHLSTIPNASALISFMDVCQSTTSRWKTLTLTDKSGASFNAGSMGTVEDILELIHENSDLQFPLLDELDIRSNGNTSDFTLSWKSPNLRTLRCTRYIPSPSYVFASVTSFTFESFLPGHNYAECTTWLLSCISSMRSLKILELEMNHVSEIEVTTALDLPLCICAAVSSFHLTLPSFKMSLARETFIGAFLEALRMPLLENLSFTIDFERMGGTASECVRRLGQLSYALLPEHLAHERAVLSTIRFSLDHAGFANVDPHGPVKEILKRAFLIPLDRMPTASTLIIQTANLAKVCFFSRKDGHRARGESATPYLREIRFKGCTNLAIGDLELSYKFLKHAETWDGLERFILEDCDNVGYDEILKQLPDMEGKLCWTT